MADNNDPKNQENQLNDAEEQQVTQDSGTDSQQANSRNQQSTAATAAATASGSQDSSAEANQAMEDDPSGAGESSDEGGSGGASAQSGGSDSQESEAAQSQVVDGSSDSGDGEQAASGSGGASGGAGAQAVGGDTAEGADGGVDAEGQSGAQASASGAAPAASSQDDSQQAGDDFDSETTSEEFAVDVQDSGAESTSETEDDFDSETTSTTFAVNVEGENDAPEVSQDLAYIMDEDGTITFTQEQLLEYASDVDGDNLTASNLQVTGSASVVDNGDGTFTVTPEQDFNGELDLTFDVSDGQEVVSSHIDLTVRPINDAPVPEDKSYSVEEDGTLTFTDEQLLENATDIDGDNLSIDGVSYEGTDGVFKDNGDGTYTFAPNENFSGEVNLTFGVSDGTETVKANIDVTVKEVNDPPVAGDTAYTINEDEVLTFSAEQLLAKSSDIEGDVAIQSVSYSGNDGILKDNGDGTFSFAPNANFNGDVSLDVVVVDEDGATDSAIAAIDVLPINDPPVSGSTAYTVDEDGSITISQEQLLANTKDVEGDDLSASNLTVDGNAQFTENPDGSFTITPDADWNGDIDLSFDVTDGTNIIQGVADLTVNPVNDLPQPQDQAFTIQEDGILTFTDAHLLRGATDIEGDDLSVESISYSGTDGILTDNGNGTYSFAPNDNFNGDVEFTFVVSDGTDKVEANVDVSVTPVNDAPTVEGNLSYSVDEDGVITLSQEQLLSNASDVEGDDLTASNLTVSGNAEVQAHSDGSFSITPDADWNGDIDIRFDVSDGENIVQSGADLTVNPVNDLPVPQDQSFTVQEDGILTFTDTHLLRGATDIEGDELTVESIHYDGADGILTNNGDGTYSFAPNENFNGDVSFSFNVSDGTDSVSANIDVSVTPQNDPPVAGHTAYTVEEDKSITISDEQLLANSFDIEGDVVIDTVSYSGTDGVFVNNGDGTYTFSPNENFSGDIRLDVVVMDEQGATDSTTAGIQVIEVNDPPIAGPTSYTIDEDSVLTFNESQVLANASDIEGDVSLVGVSYDGPDGIFSINGDGTCSFAPNENFNGQVQLNVVVQDEDGATANTVINVDVLPINDAPVSGQTAYQVDEDGSITISQEQLLAQASDQEGDDLTASNLMVDGNATVTANDDGSFTITPDADWNGDIDLTFDITDGTDTVQATADLTVNPVNDLPQPQDQAFTVQEDGILTFTDADLLNGATDIDGDDLSIDGVSYNGTNGILTDNGNGTYSFAPNENFNGDVQFEFGVNDGTATVPANIDVSVTPVDDAPTVEGSLAYTIDEDGQITLSQEQLLTHANDIDGDSLTATNLAVDGNASVTQNDDGSYTIIPDADWNGDIDISFDVSDGENLVQTGADLTVNPVNDAPDAGEELYVQAEEDQTVGVSLRDEPALRLDQAPENGIIEAHLNDEWVQLEVGQEVPADTEVRFVADESAIEAGTHTTQIGTFDDNASLDDWGTAIDPHTREFTDGDLTVRVQSNDDPLGAWNGKTHIGHGIGDTDRQGLSGDEKLTVSVEGQDINEISFHLDGLGGWFMESSRHFTEVEIKAFNDDGELIDSMTYHKEDRGSFETDYTLTVDQPVSYFELGTIQGNGTYVVQNMTVSQTCLDEAVFTSLGVDGTEITETVSLNLHQGDSEIDLTAELPNLAIDSEGAGQFASVVITEEQLLAQASDIDSENLDIQGLELVGENAEHATLIDNGDGTWTVKPDENFHGEIEVGYQVTDGELVDDNIININFESVNDAPIVSGPIVLQTDEDVGITFTAEDLLANASDIEGDDLSITDINYSGNDGELVDNGDGTYTFMPSDNFNGELDINYSVFDGQDTVDTHIDLTVVPVNDIPVPGAPLHTQMLENGSMIIEAKDLLAGATDVDGDILHIENLVLVDQSQGTLTDNGDNTFTFEPTTNFYGDVNLSFDVSDGQASAPSTAHIDVKIVNEAPEVSAPLEANVDEDGSITITQDELLANATDVDGDNLEAVNLSTNDPNATIVENENGSFTITPSENFFGEIEFTYDVTDAIETVSTGLNLTVNPINDLPDVPDLSFTTNDGESITVTQAELLAQATDIEGDELTVVNVTSQTGQVEVVDNGDGTFTLMPELGYFGNADLTFDVNDGTDTVQANIDLKVEFVNDAPETEVVAATVEEDGSILVTQEMLLANATDSDGDQLLATDFATNDPNASVVDNGDGTYTVTPSENFNGQIEFTYEVTDGELSTPNTVNLDVTPVNDAPIVAPAMYSIQEDGTILFTQEDLLSGAIDIDGDDLTVTNVEYGGDAGSITTNEDGTFTFTPEEHFSGDLSMSFTVSDGTDEVQQDINVHIEAVADAPDLVITDGDGTNVADEAILVEPGGIVELNIAAGLVDQDLSETLTVTVDGVPEGTVVRYDNEGVLNDQENGITSYNDTEITVTFEGETAGYQNAAGYYKVDEDGNITGVELVYENASQQGGGGDLLPGQSSFSFPMEEGESFNLFLIPNGYNYNDFDSMQNGSFEFRAEDGTPATMDTVDPQLVFVGEDGSVTVVESQFGDTVFHGGTSAQLNQDGIEHTRTTINEDGELVYGFEDLYGGGDADYSDFNFTIDVGEVNSQIYSGEVTVGPGGTVAIPTTAIDQNIELALPEGFNQSIEVNVTATATELSNDDSETVSQTVYINATGAHIEHAPEANPVEAYVEEDGSVLITQEDLLANARDLDGDDLTASNLQTDDPNITIVDNGDGTYTLTPSADFNGDIQFTFDVSDGDDVVSTNLDLTVSPVNDAPVPEDKQYTIEEDSTLTFTDEQLLANATDIDGDTLSIDGVSYTGTDGILTDNGDGTYSFAPNENFSGDVELSFGVSDGTETVQASIDVQVTEVNDPPVAGHTAYTVQEDNSITISDEQLLVNSSDVEGEVAINAVNYTGTDGVFTDNGDGTYTFSPNENFTGDISLDVTVVDEDGATADTTAGITVIEVNDPPVAGDTAYSVNEDEVLTFSAEQLLAQSSDIEGEVALESVSYSGSDGILTDNGDGTFSFAPNANFNGDVALDVVVVDEDGATDTATASIDVLPINDAPVSGSTSYQVNEDGSITISQEQLLANTTDIDGNDLTASNLTVDGNAEVAANDDGSFTITPDADWNGDIDLSFDVTDGTDTVQGTADLTVNPVNDLPQPEDKSYTVEEDGTLTFTDAQLLENATDIDGDTLSIDGVSYTGTDGILTDNGDGTYSFAPNENFSGDVELSFGVSDGTETVQASIDVQVTEVNDPPVAGHTAYTVQEDNSITISDEQLLANSSDVEGEVAIDAVNYTGTDGVFTDNGDGTYTFSPNENFTGDISLDVTVTDEDGATADTTAGITVIEVNDPPVAGDTAYSVNEDEVLTFSAEQLLAQSSDIEGEVALESVSYTGSDGILTDNGDGTFSFAPNANFNGEVALDVLVVDEDGATDTATASIDVLPINDAPVSGSTSYQVNEDGSITISQEQLLANTTDIDGNDLTASNLTVDGNAEVAANDDGSFTITPDADWNGDIDLSFDVTDGTDTVQGTADLTVNPVNDLPTVGAPTFTAQEDTSFTFTQEQLLQGAGDIDGDSLTVENVASDSGTLVDNGDGTYTFAPNENFDGNVNLTFDVNDGTASVPAEATIDVQSVVDMPELAIASDLVLASDNFESGSNGWNAGTESSQGFESGDMLGRIGGTGGEEAVSKTYDIPSDVNEVNISFSFYEIDSWDGESFEIFVGGEPLTSLDNSAFRTQDGTTTLYDSEGNEVGQVVHGASQQEGFSGWNDQEHQVTLTVPVEDGQLQLGFGSTLNQSVPDESFGIDNIEITVADADYQIIGTEDEPVALDIDAALTDTDGSENLSILIEDVPEGSSLSAGIDNGDGTWSLAPEELAGLEFTPAADFNGDVTLVVNATSTDVDTGTTATATQDVTIHISPANDAPEVSDGVTAVTAEDNSITITQEQLLVNATDIDGDDLSAINLQTDDPNATIEMNEDGSFTITPSDDFYGDINFTYDVTDGEEVVATSLDLSVTPVNDAPVPEDKAYSVEEDGSLTFTDAQLLAGATDIEGDTLTVEGVNYSGNDGILTDNGDGTYTFAPNENFSGDIDLTFNVSDGTDTVTANIDVQVTEVNDPPVAGHTAYTVQEDNSITISDEQLLAKASDLEGDVAIDAVNYTGTDGVFADNGDGTYTFSPNENFTGDISLDVTVIDEDGATADTTAGIEVIEVNDPPIAGPTSYTIDEDTVLTFNESQVLANASDIEGDVSLVGISYDGPHGVFSVNGDGTCSFAPNENFNGEVQLNVVIQDEDGATVDTVINVDVLPINDAPVSGSTAYQVNEDGSITISQEQLLANTTDIEGDDLTASNLTVDGNAEVTANDDGSFTITPDADWNGDIDLSFDVTDGTDTVQGTADLTVNPVNDLPQPEDKSYTVEEDGTLTFTDAQLLENATDIDGDTLSIDGVSYTGTDGILTDNGDGTYSFAPNENFSGDVELSFGVSDGTETVQASIDVQVTEVNDPPVAGHTAYTVQEDNSITISDEQLLANSSDVEGEVAIDAVNYTGTDGVFTDNGDGTYTFSPNENFTGDISLDVTVIDEDGATADTTAGITVIEVNDPPVAGDTAYSVNEDEVLTFSAEQLLAQSSDIEGEVALESVSYSGSDGILSDNGDGTFSFAPNANFNGDVALDVVVVDEDGATDTATAAIDVLPINDPPVSDNLAYSVSEDGSITLSQEQLLAQASDIDSSDLEALNLTAAGNATVVENQDGSFTITPDADFNGQIDLQFDLIDNDGASVQVGVDLTVDPANDVPVAGSTEFTELEDTVMRITPEELLANASDIDGDDLTVLNVQYTGDDGSIADTGSIQFGADGSGEIQVTDQLEEHDEFTVQFGYTSTGEHDGNVESILLGGEDGSGLSIYVRNEDGGLGLDLNGQDNVMFDGVDLNDGGEHNITLTWSSEEGVVNVYDNGELVASESVEAGIIMPEGIQPTIGQATDVLDGQSGLENVELSGFTMAYEKVDEEAIINGTPLGELSDDLALDIQVQNGEIVDVSGSVDIDVSGAADVERYFEFTPAENFNGDVTLDYQVTDGIEVVDTSANLEFIPVNDAPESDDIDVQGTEDTTILITQDMLLAKATDVDNTQDELSAIGLRIDEQFGELIDNQDGTWSFTPTENFNGDVPMEFEVSDGELTTTVSGNIDVAPVNDAPDAPTLQMQGEEDQVMVIDPSFITNQITDLDGDEISLENISVRAPANATITQQPDGMYHLVTAQDFNGLVELGYTVTDGTESVDGSLNVDVIPVNDAPFSTGNAMMATDEDGAFTFDAGDLMNLFDDIDTENLVVSRIITPEGEDGGDITDNGDGTWTFTPTEDFAGLADLQVIVSDGEFETALDVPVYVRPVADGAVITTEHDGPLVIGEDSTGHLGLNVDLIDDSETLSNLVMTGFPVGFEVSDGVNTIIVTSPDQYIDITEWNMGDLQITPPQDFTGSFNVTVSATTVDYGDEPEAFEDGIDSGDFETVAGESVILTADDLMAIAENVDVDAGDEVKFVHLTDRSQGEIVDNGDGTWTFNPAPGFTGEVDIAYVIDKDGVLHDEQTGIVVNEPDEQDNAAPEVESIATTDLEPGATLEFTDSDMLANLSDAENDALSIESVSMMEGQGIIESDNEGNYQFTPAEGYEGPVEIGFIATDGENRIESQFNVNLQGSSEVSDEYVQGDDGSIVFAEEQILNELDLSPSAEVLDVADSGDVGFFVDSGDNEWTFWPNDDFNGEVPMKVEVNDKGTVEEHSLTVTAQTEASPQAANEFEEAQMSVESEAQESQPIEESAIQEGAEEEADADMTAAPGDTINIAIPDEVTQSDDVDHVEMSGLPDGSTVSGALDSGDGNYTISGDLSQPVSVELPEGFEGNVDVGFQGYDELGSQVDEAQASVTVEVDDQHAMSANQNQDGNTQVDSSDGSGGDWTTSGGQEAGVDFNDDSGSFDNDHSDGGNYENDFDNNSF
ncbi:tandem-95 repeat protein [Vibrio agarivorans]|uniref:Tandem-95 repeat protein n=1 Tax=Vibrio agarivorans TaxID=153622 RepID=A0ABT7Y5T0_9VIBR|nr:tandem-95 repeat protein [Vibrio agarivorans]MDN2483094.1 tandem-95 repeat protein [Vibrio agarivorans]